MKSALRIVLILGLATASAACGKNEPAPSPGSSAAADSFSSEFQNLPASLNTHERTDGEYSRCQITVEKDVGTKRISLIGNSNNISAVCPVTLTGVGSLTFDCSDNGKCVNANNYGNKDLSLTYRMVLVNAWTLVLYEDSKPAGSQETYTKEIRFY